jgi:hypothetical protein
MNETIPTTNDTVAIFVHMIQLILLLFEYKVNGVTLRRSFTGNLIVFMAAVIRTFDELILVFCTHTIPPYYFLKLSAMREHLPYTENNDHN